MFSFSAWRKNSNMSAINSTYYAWKSAMGPKSEIMCDTNVCVHSCKYYIYTIYELYLTVF